MTVHLYKQSHNFAINSELLVVVVATIGETPATYALGVGSSHFD